MANKELLRNQEMDKKSLEKLEEILTKELLSLSESEVAFLHARRGYLTKSELDMYEIEDNMDLGDSVDSDEEESTDIDYAAMTNKERVAMLIERGYEEKDVKDLTKPELITALEADDNGEGEEEEVDEEEEA